MELYPYTLNHHNSTYLFHDANSICTYPLFALCVRKVWSVTGRMEIAEYRNKIGSDIS